MGIESSSAIFFRYTFHYEPVLALAAAAAALFGVATVLAAVQTARFRKPRVSREMILITVTGLAEVLGYALRIITMQTLSVNAYIGTTLLLLVAPLLPAGINYFVLGQILKATNRSVFGMQARRIGAIFVTGDVLCFFIQSGGGGMLAMHDENMARMGNNIAIFGLALQMAFFALFVATLSFVTYGKAFNLRRVKSLRGIFIQLFGTTLLLFVRNLYRLLEFAAGLDGPIMSHEWIFYTFETLPLLLCFVLYVTLPFGKVLPSGEDAEWVQEVAEFTGRRVSDVEVDDLSKPEQAGNKHEAV